ncbi:hypothetical protein DEU56DRAFT_913144 [Suillus clintonianus]|uniref:uncharacterized protein n=1 Tax=Suillus clintonianus TaxID=1904413 RepID=UPI001B8822A0|nr:uncharacterized protein DEU56DRAFT_913144 [Suillus clintonianus]KAG2135760.1 hypothetical protein DEU56DRAFT_913144 [Suillus clintonianus]
MGHRRGPKPWASNEQEAFLLARLPDYIKCQPSKRYRDFLVDTGLAFLAKWPERAYLSRNGIPAEGPLTPDQFKIVQTAIKARKTAIVRWYRWQTNTARLARSGNSNVELKLGVTLNGGDELKGTRAPQEVEVYSHCHYESRVKVAANTAIAAAGGTSSRGEKLCKRKEVTRIKYASEDEVIRAEVKEKHREALAKWKHDRELARAGFVEEVSDDAKIQAFNELGPHLDRIFRHLSYKTGGLKFTCIAGGRNPATGEIVVVDFHLGETDTGGEFATCYPGFSDVQAAYANFLKEAISHDDNMLALVNADVSAETRIDNELGEAEETDADVSAEARINNELGEAEETNEEDKDKAMRDDEDERNTGSAQSLESLDLYHIGPQEDNQIGLQDIALGLGIGTRTTTSACLPDYPHSSETEPPSFGDINFWNIVGAEEFNNMLAVSQDPFHPSFIDTGFDPSFPQPQHDPFQHASAYFAPNNLATVQNPDYPIEDFFLNTGYPYGGKALLEPVLPVTAPHNAPSTQTSNIPAPDIPSPVMTTPPALPASAQSEYTNILVSGGRPRSLAGPKANEQMNGDEMVRPTFGLTAELQPDEGPRRTARRHIPSNRAQVLNAIGSSNARVCATLGGAKHQ